MTMTSGYVTDNADLLRQGLDAMRQLGPAGYGDHTGGAEVSPPGAHFRHVFDHYRAFLDGLADRRVNYDARARDPRLEQDVAAAAAAAEDLTTRLLAIDEARLTDPLSVSGNVIVDGRSVVDWTPSTVQRELMYLLSHTVHHYAIIRLLALARGVELHREFGVAPSTLAYRRQQESCAPSAG